jgi:hypothetical protein
MKVTMFNWISPTDKVDSLSKEEVNLGDLEALVQKYDIMVYKAADGRICVAFDEQGKRFRSR